MATLKTLDRAISKAGLGSRTEARSWIGGGRVSVNGRVIQTPDHWVDLQRDKILFDGKAIGESEKIYWLLYKPRVTSLLTKIRKDARLFTICFPNAQAGFFPWGASIWNRVDCC